MPVTIPPEIGRTLYFHANGNAAHSYRAGAHGPLAAKIVAVHGSNMVNLAVFNANGDVFGVSSVELKQPGEEAQPGWMYCAWMPWQVEQAKLKAVRDSIAARFQAAAERDACGKSPIQELAEGNKNAADMKPDDLKDRAASSNDPAGTPVIPCAGDELPKVIPAADPVPPVSSWLKK